MTLDQEKYAFTDGKTPLSAAELNARFFAIVRRLHALELLSIDWETAVAQVQNHGLARINEAVVPLIEALKTDLADLIAQGREDLAAQAAAVDAKLSEVDATMETVTAAIADITARIVAVEASQQQLATVTLPATLKRAKQLALILG